MSKTAKDVLVALERAIRETGNAAAWAKAHGIAPQAVCDVRKRRRQPSQKIAAALGFRRLTVFVKINKSGGQGHAAD